MAKSNKRVFEVRGNVVVDGNGQQTGRIGHYASSDLRGGSQSGTPHQEAVSHWHGTPRLGKHCHASFNGVRIK